MPQNKHTILKQLFHSRRYNSYELNALKLPKNPIQYIQKSTQNQWILSKEDIQCSRLWNEKFFPDSNFLSGLFQLTFANRRALIK